MKQLKTYIQSHIQPHIQNDVQESFFDDVEDITSSDLEKKFVLDFLKDNYTIDLNKVSFRNMGSKLIVDVDGGVSVINKNISSLTNDLFEFGIVKRYFICAECAHLTSLKGSPEKVKGWFECYECPNLKSLEGAPSRIDGSFDCSGCENLISLKGAPVEVGGRFDCWACSKLTSLEGAPKKVGGNFFCYDCPALKITDDDRKKYIIKDGK